MVGGQSCEVSVLDEFVAAGNPLQRQARGFVQSLIHAPPRDDGRLRVAAAEAGSPRDAFMQGEGGSGGSARAAVEGEVGVDALDFVTGLDAVYGAEDGTEPRCGGVVDGVDEVLSGAGEGSTSTRGRYRRTSWVL